MRGRSSGRRSAVPAPRSRSRSPAPLRRSPSSVVPAPPSRSTPREDRLLLATFTVRVPDTTWFGPFSRRHPGLAIEILGSRRSGSHAIVADLWIQGVPPGLWTREIATYPDVGGAECLTGVGDGALYRARIRTPPVVDLYRRLRMPLPYPIRIRGGSVRWEVVARRAEFVTLLAFARKVDPRTRVTWTRTVPLRSHLPVLTTRQRELLHAAIESGYFASPPKISLGELARASGRGRVATSKVLAQIEERLLGSALREPILSARRPAPADAGGA